MLGAQLPGLPSCRLSPDQASTRALVSPVYLFRKVADVAWLLNPKHYKPSSALVMVNREGCSLRTDKVAAPGAEQAITGAAKGRVYANTGEASDSSLPASVTTKRGRSE